MKKNSRDGDHSSFRGDEKSVSTTSTYSFILGPGQFFGEKALDTDTLRSATVQALSVVELISLTRKAYQRIIKNNLAATTTEKQGKKAIMYKILSKDKNRRTAEELSVLSSYLTSRVPFFKMFAPDLRLEMCRAIEVIRTWGTTILFHQGEVGKAFYILFSGTATVNVSSAAGGGMDTFVQVNTLSEGASFGERAIENEDSVRTATVITGEGLTEILVISRTDYVQLIASMRARELTERLELQRHTHYFAELPTEQLKIITKFMEPRKFHSGKKVDEDMDIFNMFLSCLYGPLYTDERLIVVVERGSLPDLELYVCLYGMSVRII